MSTTVTWPGGTTGATATSYNIPAAGELNWAALSDFLNALANGAQVTTFQKFAIRKATTSPVTVAVTDCAVGSKLAAPAAVTMNLPAGANKQLMILFDDTGDADTNNITINPNGADTIGGSASYMISANRGWVVLLYLASDTDWKIIAQASNDVDYTASKALVTDSGGDITTATTTATQIGYLSGASGTTGTGSLVYSSSPTLVSPTLGQAVATTINGLLLNSGDSSQITVAGGFQITISGTATTNITVPISGTLYGTKADSITSAQLKSSLSDETGSGAAVFATSPTLVTPVLGTPSSGTLTSCTGLPVSSGISGLGSGIATFLATPSSANLATALTDETGSGAAVFATSPTLVTPALGAATATSIAAGGALVAAVFGATASNATSDAIALIENTNTTAAAATIALRIKMGAATMTGALLERFEANGQVLGSISVGGATSVLYNLTSDRRLKIDINSYDALPIVKALNPIRFKWKDDSKTFEHGFIAQEVYEVLPEMVNKGGDDPKMQPWGMDYGRLTGVLCKAIQEQQDQIDLLKNMVNDLVKKGGKQ